MLSWVVVTELSNDPASSRFIKQKANKTEFSAKDVLFLILQMARVVNVIIKRGIKSVDYLLLISFS